MKNLIIAALVAIVAVGGALAFAQTRTVETEAKVEVTVWQSVSSDALYLSTRPEGGSWTTHQTPLDMSALSSSGRFRQGSAIGVAVPVSVEVEQPDPPADPPTEFIPSEWYTIAGDARPEAKDEAEAILLRVMTWFETVYGITPSRPFVVNVWRPHTWLGRCNSGINLAEERCVDERTIAHEYAHVVVSAPEPFLVEGLACYFAAQFTGEVASCGGSTTVFTSRPEAITPLWREVCVKAGEATHYDPIRLEWWCDSTPNVRYRSHFSHATAELATRLFAYIYGHDELIRIAQGGAPVLGVFAAFYSEWDEFVYLPHDRSSYVRPADREERRPSPLYVGRILRCAGWYEVVKNDYEQAQVGMQVVEFGAQQRPRGALNTRWVPSYASDFRHGVSYQKRYVESSWGGVINVALDKIGAATDERFCRTYETCADAQSDAGDNGLRERRKISAYDADGGVAYALRPAGRGWPIDLVPQAFDGDGDGVVCEQ